MKLKNLSIKLIALFAVGLFSISSAYATKPVSLQNSITDFALAVGTGVVRGVSGVSKFGASPSGIQTTVTDIWALANAAVTQQIWLAPTVAAIHDIVSSDASDDTIGVNDGARTIRIWGLKTWATLESSEDIIMNGTTVVPTVNSYVIIHRMRVLTSGASINIGIIKATAKAPSDLTITALILAGEGQTEMAIYGVPSIQDFYLTRWEGSIDKATGAVASADFHIRVNENPNIQTTNYILKNDIAVQSTGNNTFEKHYKYYPKFSGPCIIKIQADSSANDLDGQAGFDGFLVLN